jgi:hypothetical protein
MLPINKSSLVIEPFFIQEGRPLKDFLFLDEPNSGISKDKTKWSKRFSSLHNGTTKEVEINNNGFRSNEFKTNHSEHHVLFMGCSVTWGSGLYWEETWSNKLYNKFLKDFNLSGYFNLGIPGDSIFSQIVYAFKYFKQYGNPNTIFFNMPEIKRFYAYSEIDKSLTGAGISKDENKILNLLSYQYYYMFEQYCLSNSINLLSFSWAEYEFDAENSNIKEFDTFFSINRKDLLSHVDLYSKANLKDKFSIVARDGIHFGTAYSEYWSNFMYEKYKSLTSISNEIKN